MAHVLMREMTWAEIEPLANDGTVVILPVAAMEQHGKHLPIDVDSLLCETVARRAAEAASSQARVLVAPTLSFGSSQHHMAFPGTFTLTTGTFIRVVEELCESLIYHGFRRILILNGHGGNDDLIRIAARNVADTTGAAVAASSYWNVAADDLSIFQDDEVGGIPGHACGFETACYLAVKPELVRMDVAAAWAPPAGRSGDYGKRITRQAGIQMPKQATPVSDYGTRGDPRRGSVEKGQRYLELIERRLAEAVVAMAQGDAPSSPASYPGPGRPTAAAQVSTDGTTAS
jgi:creatinine amidohydrolase